MNVIAHNIAAMNAQRQLKIVGNSKQKSTEKLSSGYRINRAADDAAGLSISEKMRAQIRGLNQGSENIENGISFVQVADGALEEVHGMLQRLNELAVKSANGTNSDSDRRAIDAEVQQLKMEMQRVFKTTTFNEKPVWPEENIDRDLTWIGKREVQAVKVTTPYSQSSVIDNDAYDKVAYGGYDIAADDTGVTVSWKDYDGVDHETTTIDWDTLVGNNYSFQIADYFDSGDTELFDAGGNPVFDFKVSFSVVNEAEIADIIKAINETSMSNSLSVSMSGQFEDSTGAVVSKNGVSVSGAYINYAAAYAARENANTANNETGYDFDNGSDGFLEATAVTANNGNLNTIPANNSTDVPTASSNGDNWSFTFKMEGIGEVKATSSSVLYYSPDGDPEDEGLWWDYYEYDGRKDEYTMSHGSSEQGAGTLGAVMATLTGDRGSATPGLLNKNEGGVSDQGGTIQLSFQLTSTNSFTYAGNETSNSVGSLYLNIAVSKTDTEQTVLDKINDALNSATIIDFHATKSTANSSRQYVYASSEKEALVEQDVYRVDEHYKDIDVTIHSGATTEDKIHLKYECLRLGCIGLAELSMMTEDKATNAINEVANAIDIISEQRSLFGAYQNRLEYAKAIDENTAENTTAAESRIRDTDMAEEMVKYAKENILQQAGQAMVAQANQSTQGVLSLLN